MATQDVFEFKALERAPKPVAEKLCNFLTKSLKKFKFLVWFVSILSAELSANEAVAWPGLFLGKRSLNALASMVYKTNKLTRSISFANASRLKVNKQLIISGIYRDIVAR